MQASLAALLLFTAACSSGGSLMTMSKFYDVPIGATQNEVVTSMGEPYSIKRHSDGTEEYEYVERVKIGSRYAEDRRYYLYLKEGKVVSKKVKQGAPPPYTFDSYEMQTTQTVPNDIDESKVPSQ